jgi:hypothetical protein
MWSGPGFSRSGRGHGSGIPWCARRCIARRRSPIAGGRTGPSRRSPIRRLDPDRRVWHRARATADPDEEVAAELERSAGRARERGGLAAAAAFLERAVELTPDPARRGQRLLLAAQAEHLAGATDAAMQRLAIAQAGPLDELGRARVEQLRAHMAFASRRGSDAPPLLLDAARRLEPLDPGLARETYLEALCAAVFAGSLARDGGVVEVARAALAAPRPRAQDPTGRDLLLVGMATRFTEGYAAAAPTIRRALRACITEACTEDALRWMWFAGMAAAGLWDDEAWEFLATRHLMFVCESGALGELELALCLRTTVHTVAGELPAAEGLVVEHGRPPRRSVPRAPTPTARSSSPPGEGVSRRCRS